MDRRDFGRAMVLGLAGVGLSEGSRAAAARPASRAVSGSDAPYRVLPDLPVRQNDGIRMGGDYQNVAGTTITDPKSLAYYKRFNANHVTAMAPTAATKEELWDFPQFGGFLNADGPWDGDRLKRMQDNCQKADMVLEGIRMDSAYIIMKEGPKRNQYLDIIRENIRKAAAAGISLISYHWTMIPIRRNGEVPGRGGSSYGTFKLEPNWRDLPPTEVAGRVSLEDYWSRIDYFLKNIVPVAREMKVKLACHPYDPGGLPLGYQGVDNWDAGDYIAALKKYELLYDDIYNGFTYDTGVAGESIDDPNAQLDILRYLAERGKIAQMHFRNVRGGRNNFIETYHDDGDINLLNCMRVLRDTGWTGTLLPDHVPLHADDPDGLQGFAFAYGYMEGLIKAVRDEATRVMGMRAR